jgi:long-chain fatty acid transport protein
MRIVRNGLRISLAALIGGLAHDPSDAYAAGYALDVQSGRGTGMAAAVTGFIDDSSAIYYNPAGISQGKGFDAQVGVTAIAPSFKFTGRGESKSTKFEVVPPVHAYATFGITDELSAGIGVFTPFGLTIKWPEDWIGRRQITEASLATFFINPTVAYRIGPVRIGAGLQVVRATVRLKRQIAFGETEGSTDLGAGTWGLGGNIGAQVEAIPKVLSFGAHYRSAVKLSFDGKADFGNVPSALQNTIHDQPVSTSLLTPDSFAMGVAVRPIPALVLDADVVWFGWGNLRSIDLNFEDTSLSSSRAKSWKSGLNYHVGGEAAVAESWRVRAGALYDPSPAPKDTLTPDIPDADRLNLALGGSYVHASGFHVDLGYQFLILFKKESTAPELPGEYGGFVNILGVSVGYATTPTKVVATTASPPPPTYMETMKK